MKSSTNRTGHRSLLSEGEEFFTQGGPFDRSNPRSLINIAPREIVDILLEKVPLDLLYMSETELEDKLRPGPVIQRIRIAFWKEYEKAQSEIRKMQFSKIALELGQPSLFLLRTLKDPEKLAVVLCPVTSYDNFLEESLMAGLKRLRSIVEMPLFDHNGRPDHKTMDIVLKTVAFLDMRKNGGIVQRQLQVNVNKSTQNAVLNNVSLEELDEKIRQLESGKSVDKEIGEIEAKFSRTPTGD